MNMAFGLNDLGYMLLPPLQIVVIFGFSRYVVLLCRYIVQPMYLEKPKHLIIWKGSSRIVMFKLFGCIIVLVYDEYYEL
jgi:hypothetical protein